MEQKPTPEQMERAKALVAANIEKWGWGPIDEIKDLAEHKLAVDAALAAILQSDQQQAELLRALEPFALVAEHDIGEDEADHDLHRHMDKHNRAPRLTVGDFRRAFREWQGGRSDG